MSRGTRNEMAGTCEEAAANWVFRLEAGLTAEEEAAFDQWRAADPRHAIALERHRLAWSALDRPRQAGQEGLLLGKLAERAFRRRRRRVGLTSATLALLIAGTMIRDRLRPGGLNDSGTMVILPDTRILTDGTIVELNYGAEIAVDFAGPLRRVALLQGEAHFQVAHQDRPFVVTAIDVDFRAVGTSFFVQLAGRQVELLVTEGRVAVEKPAAQTQTGGGIDRVEFPPVAAETLAMAASGNRVIIALENEAGALHVASTAVPPEEMSERLAWRVPRLDFTDTPLAEAVALMNRHNHVQLVIEDAALGKMLVSGLFRADRTEAFVRLLEANFDVRTEIAGHRIHLRRNR
jgi:transmembrane sensor